MIISNRLFAGPAVLAALSLTAIPASAAELPATSGRSALAADLAWQPVAESAQDHRPWRGHRHRRDRDGIDVGGVIAGALLIGGIAAVASAATRDSHRADYRAPPPPPYNPAPYSAPYPDQGADYAASAARACIDAIEHDARVDGGLAVDRRASGFTVRGHLIDGPSFTCDVARDGRIERIAYDGEDAAPPQPYGMSEEQRAYRDGRMGADAREAAPGYPGMGSDDVPPGDGVDTRPEYPGDLPQNQTQDEDSEPATNL